MDASVTVACPTADALARETARIVTVLGKGTLLGAAYTPAALMVPTVDEPPVEPLTDQMTDVFAVPETAAANAWFAPT
jgi:hypothetical protein